MVVDMMCDRVMVQGVPCPQPMTKPEKDKEENEL